MAPAFRFLTAQIAAFITTLLLARVDVVAGAVAGWGWVGVDAVVATVLAIVFRLAWWWWPPALILPFAVTVASGVPVPWWTWASASGLLALVYGGGMATRVPLYLSNKAAARELAGLLPSSPGVRACDLGAGLGGPALALARQRPDASITGIEASPLPWLVCRLRALSRRNLRMGFGDLFRHPLVEYDLVYAFLSPAPMPRLWAKACAEMRPGTLFVSNTFAVPGAEPERTIVLPGRSDARLLVYRIPPR